MPISIAIVDYGMGNQASVVHALRGLDFRVKLADSPDGLNDVDLLVLPGVGAFPAAMQALRERGLADCLRLQALDGHPILGICLGMQLLAEASHEHGRTSGLGLIPGEFEAFPNGDWHIGWNTITCRRDEPLLAGVNGEAFYFNHSYRYKGPEQVQVAHAGDPRPCAAIVKKGKVVGVQFHPEKSQAPGRTLLKDLITGLAHA